MNIVLIGYMGVGKGRTARMLASMTYMYSVDTDDLIESFANTKIKTIFMEQGEETFREFERKTALWLETGVNNTVISTGGGFYKVPNLKKIGKIIYLHGEFESIIKGILEHPNAKKKIKKRPLLQDLNAAETLYNERLPVYQKIADIVINVDGKDSTQVSKEIVQKLG